MKILHWSIGIIFSYLLIIIMLISSVDIAAYSDYGWYEKAYRKYEVLDDLEMEMQDVMHVTEEMMSYLRGNRKDLNVETIVDGEEREFFNDREKAHMEDVRNLFVGARWIRGIGIVLLIVFVIVLILTKANLRKLLPKSLLIGSGSFVAMTCGLVLLCMSDFTKYFTIFHEIFFSNDLWLLNPRTDLLIRMLPEGFFSDMALRIGIIFLAILVLLVASSIFVLIRKRNKKN